MKDTCKIYTLETNDHTYSSFEGAQVKYIAFIIPDDLHHGLIKMVNANSMHIEQDMTFRGITESHAPSHHPLRMTLRVNYRYDRDTLRMIWKEVVRSAPYIHIHTSSSVLTPRELVVLSRG